MVIVAVAVRFAARKCIFASENRISSPFTENISFGKLAKANSNFVFIIAYGARLVNRKNKKSRQCFFTVGFASIQQFSIADDLT